jgi:[acyl-carrier-protein] S-malonyltransferase
MQKSHNTAVVFPGQGAQRKGMGLDFFAQFEESKRIFNIASETLAIDILGLCRDGDPRVDLTEFTQPCVLTAEIAMFEALKKHFGFSPEYFGGHSLGEYTALVAAGVIPFDVALQLVHTRGRLMQWSTPAGTGKMAAVIREGGMLPYDEIFELAANEDVDIANDNSPCHIAVSGERTRVERLCEKISARFANIGVRTIFLTVSAPFHSRHMVEIESAFAKIIDVKIRTFDMRNAARVTSNFTGRFHTESMTDLKESLMRQISGLVRWRDNMSTLIECADSIVEVGPNRPLGMFFKVVGTQVQSIVDLRTARRALMYTSATPAGFEAEVPHHSTV